MILTVAAIIRDPDTGRDRGVDIEIRDGQISITLHGRDGRAASTDVTDHRAAIVAALKEGKAST